MLSVLQFGVFDFVLLPSLNGLIVPALIVLGVLLFAWDWIKPLAATLVNKAKGLVIRASDVVISAPSTTSGRVALWEELYEACAPCPKARELLTEVFQHLAPHHSEIDK